MFLTLSGQPVLEEQNKLHELKHKLIIFSLSIINDYVEFDKPTIQNL